MENIDARENESIQDSPVLLNSALLESSLVGDVRLAEESQSLDQTRIHTIPHQTPRVDVNANDTSLEDSFSLGSTARVFNALPDIPFDDRIKARLISTFFQDVAAWFETTNSLQHFSVLYGHLVTNSAAFGSAAMSLASRYLETTTSQAGIYQSLYDFSLNASVGTAEDDTLLLTVIIHCMFCAMSSETSHVLQPLIRCATLLQSDRWNRSSSGLPAAVYWAFARLGR